MITFIQNAFFTEAATGLSIPYSYETYRSIPKQLRSDSKI